MKKIIGKLFWFVILLFSIGSILYGGYHLLKNKSDYKKSDQTYEKVRQKKKKNGDIDFKKLPKNVVGWIQIKGTPIDYPIMQAKNNSYYLHRSIHGNYLFSGCPFMDYRNNKKFTDRNTIVYGHNLNNGTMFAALTKFNTQSYYRKHKTVKMYIKGQGKKKYDVIAAYVTSYKSQTYNRQFSTQEDYQKHLEFIKQKSNIKTDIPYDVNKNIITLSTCYHNGTGTSKAVVILQEREKRRQHGNSKENNYLI